MEKMTKEQTNKVLTKLATTVNAVMTDGKVPSRIMRTLMTSFGIKESSWDRYMHGINKEGRVYHFDEEVSADFFKNNSALFSQKYRKQNAKTEQKQEGFVSEYEKALMGAITKINQRLDNIEKTMYDMQDKLNKKRFF